MSELPAPGNTAPSQPTPEEQRAIDAQARVFTLHSALVGPRPGDFEGLHNTGVRGVYVTVPDHQQRPEDGGSTPAIYVDRIGTNAVMAGSDIFAYRPQTALAPFKGIQTPETDDSLPEGLAKEDVFIGHIKYGGHRKVEPKDFYVKLTQRDEAGNPVGQDVAFQDKNGAYRVCRVEPGSEWDFTMMTDPETATDQGVEDPAAYADVVGEAASIALEAAKNRAAQVHADLEAELRARTEVLEAL